MNILRLIDTAQGLGANFTMKEGQLYIENAMLLPDEILHELKQAKEQLYLTFKRDQAAKEQDLLIYLPGTLYGVSPK